MRHKRDSRRFGRTSSHKQAMFRNMVSALVQHEIIKTTVPKAKELRRIVERLVTLARNNTVAKRRLAFARIRNKEAVRKLFDIIAPRYQERAGGYTRILKAGFRHSDAAPVAYIEFVDRSYDSDEEDYEDYDDESEDEDYGDEDDDDEEDEDDD